MEKEVHNLLRRNILAKIGKEVLYGKDCIFLVKQIYERTHRQISVSTVKRFFGLIKTKFYPSKYTLDTFSIFLGFDNWQDFKENIVESVFEGDEDISWESMRKQFQVVTSLSILSLKQKTGYDPDKMVFREFGINMVAELRKSDKNMNMVIAPSGYGKSTLMVQLTEENFLRENALFPNDIVALIDGGIFFNLYARNPKNELLNQLLDFKVNEGFYHYFQQYPEKRKGKIWIIIDSIDDIFFDRERYHHFAENLTRIVMSGENGWLKFIFTSRPENVDIFTCLVQKNPLLKEYLYNPEFVDQKIDEVTTIPLFSEKEVEIILKRLDFQYSYNYLRTYHKDVISILRYPFFLSLFVSEFGCEKEISEITLLKCYIMRRLNAPPYLEEKRKIINAFMELCNMGKEKNFVQKDKLLVKVNHVSAYRELISYGLLYEYIIPGETLYIDTYVRFRQNIIFEYLLFEKWRSKKTLSPSLFFKISHFYQNTEQLQCRMLQFFIRDTLLEKKYETIKQIHLQMEAMVKSSEHTLKQPLPCLSILSSIIKEALQTDTDLRKNLMMWLSRTKIGKFYYAGC